MSPSESSLGPEREPAHRIALVGAGAVARAFAPRLTQAGWDVMVWARRPEQALRAAGDAGDVALSLAELAGRDLVLLAVSDSAHAELAERLAQVLPPPAPGAVALHVSGFHELDVLDPLAGAGWSVGSVHPLVSFPRGGGGEGRLARAWFAVAGDERARAAARSLVRLFGGRELALEPRPGARRVYHASAALCAGGLVALVDLALRGLGEIAPSADARAALSHLLRGIAEGLATIPPAEALTGPTARGDERVVAEHLECLPAQAAEVYRALVPVMLDLACRRGLDPLKAEAFEARLAEVWPPSAR